MWVSISTAPLPLPKLYVSILNRVDTVAENTQLKTSKYILGLVTPPPPKLCVSAAADEK